MDAVSWLDELRIVRRESALVPAALALAALAALAIWSGERWLDERERVEATMVAERAEREKWIDEGLAALERGEDSPRVRSASSIWWRLQTFAVEPRNALALTALGARDSSPPALEFEDRRMGSAPAEEQRNPALLASGRFDLAFLITLLAPWFAIALAHRLAAGERESGRWSLLESHARSPWLLLAQRATWIVVVLTGAASAAVVATLAALGRLDAVSVPLWLAWTSVCALVLAFWTTLALAVDRLQRGSTFNLSVLGSAWVLLCWAAPVAVSEFAARERPVESRTELARLARKETNAVWDERAKYKDDVFRALGVAAGTAPANVNAEEWQRNVDGLAYSFEAVRRVGPAAERIESQRRDRAQLERTLSFVSPALAAHHALLAIAGSAPLERMALEDTLQRKHEDDRRLLALAIVQGRDLGLEDWKTLRSSPSTHASSPVSVAGGPLLALALWLLAAATAAVLFRSRRASSTPGAEQRARVIAA